jgi:hypothetical protein
MIYPFSKDQIRRIAYHFLFDYSDGRNPSKYIKNFEKEVRGWIATWEKKSPLLVVATSDDTTVMCDTRPCAMQKIIIFESESEKAIIYKMCESIQSFYSIYARYKEINPNATEQLVYRELDDLINKKLMIYHDNMYLSLAIPLQT